MTRKIEKLYEKPQRVVNPDGSSQLKFPVIKINDWGECQRLLGEMLSSLNKIENNIKVCDAHEDEVVAHDLTSLAKGMRENEANRELLRSIRTNRADIHDFMHSGGHHRGLVHILREVFGYVSDLGDKHGKTAAHDMEVLRNMKKDIGNDGVEHWVALRELLNRKIGFDARILTTESENLDNLFVGILVNYIYVHELIRNNDEYQKEALLYQMLDLCVRLEDIRDYYMGEFDKFVTTGLSSSQNSMFKNQLQRFFPNNPRSFTRDEFKELFRNLSRIKENYFRKFNTPVANRWEEMQKILSEANHQYHTLKGDDKKRADELYKELTEYIFSRTTDADMFKDRKAGDDVKKLQKEFDDLVDKLIDELAEKGYSASETDIEELVLYSVSQRGKIKKLLPGFQKEKAVMGKPYTFADVLKALKDENFADKDKKKLMELFKTTLEKIRDKPSQMDSFISVQEEADNFISQKAFKDLKEKYEDLVDSIHEDVASEWRTEKFKRRAKISKKTTLEDVENSIIKNKDLKGLKPIVKELEKIDDLEDKSKKKKRLGLEKSGKGEGDDLDDKKKKEIKRDLKDSFDSLKNKLGVIFSSENIDNSDKPSLEDFLKVISGTSKIKIKSDGNSDNSTFNKVLKAFEVDISQSTVRAKVIDLAATIDYLKEDISNVQKWNNLVDSMKDLFGRDFEL